MAARKSTPKRPQASKTSSPKRRKATAKKSTAKKSKPAAKKSAPQAPTRKAVTKRAAAERAPTKRAAAERAPTKRAAAERAPAKRAARSTAARDARSALAQKKAIEATLSPSPEGSAIVDAYLLDVDHPFKAEMQAVRQIILEASPKIAERIKWNAPSFHYKEDLGAFNPRATEYAHLILLFPGGEGIPKDAWLEGNHKDRREAKFHGLDDVARKKPALTRLVKRWVAQRDA